LSLPEGGLELVTPEVFEGESLTRWHSLLGLGRGLAGESILESLLFVCTSPLGVAGVVALNDINRLFNGLIIGDFLHGLH
jgi:hypothetical protein